MGTSLLLPLFPSPQVVVQPERRYHPGKAVEYHIGVPRLMVDIRCKVVRFLTGEFGE